MREDLLIELENEYARMRADNERTEETRKEKIRLEQPEIFALTQEREELVFGTLRNIVKGAGKRADDLPERMEKLNEKIRNALTEKGYHVLSAEAEKIPANYTQLTDEDAIKKMQLLLDHLEENDDVQNVYHNWEMPEEE